MGDLSAHFDSSEFVCRGWSWPGHEDHDTYVDDHLVEHLERLRSGAGDVPLRIVSGHRCAWWNQQVGGASASQHLAGRAADIPHGYATTDQAEEAGFTGIGSDQGWAIHVDVRDDPARWEY